LEDRRESQSPRKILEKAMESKRKLPESIQK
jgi:hypothetical protein